MRRLIKTYGKKRPLDAFKREPRGHRSAQCFFGAKPQFVLTAQNWRPAAASGALQWKVFDPQGDVVKSGNETINVEDNFSLSLPLDIPRFGVYRLDSTIAWQGGKTQTTSQPFAVIPVAKELTGTEKDASPYGLNVHSGGDVMVSEFRKAGIVWFRDYGFNYDWMLRAKGADKSYGGWPWYPKIVQKYKDNDVRVLANLATALKPPTEGHTAPDLNWVREMVGIQTAFPSLRYFELDNEYDLNAANAKAEDAIAWKNYGNYHKKFG